MSKTASDFVALLTKAGWTKQAEGTMEFTNDAGLSSEFFAYEDEGGTLTADLYTAKPGEKQRIYGLFFPIERTEEIIGLIDKGARAMTEKDRDGWLKDIAKRDVYVAWQKSTSERITFPRS